MPTNLPRAAALKARLPQLTTNTSAPSTSSVKSCEDQSKLDPIMSPVHQSTTLQMRNTPLPLTPTSDRAASWENKASVYTPHVSRRTLRDWFSRSNSKSNKTIQSKSSDGALVPTRPSTLSPQASLSNDSLSFGSGDYSVPSPNQGPSTQSLSKNTPPRHRRNSRTFSLPPLGSTASPRHSTSPLPKHSISEPFSSSCSNGSACFLSSSSQSQSSPNNGSSRRLQSITESTSENDPKSPIPGSIIRLQSSSTSLGSPPGRSTLKKCFFPGRATRSLNDPNTQPLPTYLRNIPDLVKRAFNLGTSAPPLTLSAHGSGFRELVREHCKFPSYCGPVLFRRALEYRKIVDELIAEGMLSSKEFGHDEQISQGRINHIDFLRVYPPAVHAADEATRFRVLMSPITKKLVLQREEIYNVSDVTLADCEPAMISMRDIQPLIESLVERHPDFRFMRDDAVMRERYVLLVLLNIFAPLGGLCSGKITFKDLKESNLPYVFDVCARGTTDYIAPFNRASFHKIHNAFNACVARPESPGSNYPTRRPAPSMIDKSDLDKASCSLEQLKARCPWNVSEPILDRVFQGYGAPLTCDKANRLNFEDFARFAIACRDQMADVSVDYWFRCLDFDEDGYFSFDDMSSLSLPSRRPSEDINVWKTRRMAEWGIIHALGLPRIGFKNCHLRLMDVRAKGMGVHIYSSIILCADSTVAQQRFQD